MFSETPRQCCIGKCRSIYSGIDEKQNVFSFPIDCDKCEKQIGAPLNTINGVTKYIGVCEKHWPTGYEKIKKATIERLAFCI